MDPKNILDEIVESATFYRRRFEMEVEATCLEIIEMAKQISPAIGEISINEAKEAITKEFTKRLYS
jgi:hypothetical protein